MRGRFRRDDQGAAAVEFALVSVLLFTLLFGIIQYGFLFFQYQAAASTAHEAARLFSLGPTAVVSNPNPNACTPYITSVGDFAESNGLSVDDITQVGIAWPGNTSATLQIGTVATSRVTFTPTAFGVAFVPMPDQITVSAASTVERVGVLNSPCQGTP